MNVTEEDYKKANLCFGINQFVISFLTYIKEPITGTDIKSAKNLIRFHAYYQHTKGNLTDGSNISIAQAAVATLLDEYIQKIPGPYNRIHPQSSDFFVNTPFYKYSTDIDVLTNIMG